MNNIEDILFMGLDIPSELEKDLKLIEKKVLNNMSIDELKAYQLGVDVAVSRLRRMLIDGEHLFIHINHQPKKEYTIKELADVYTDKMLLYTE